MPRLLPLVLQMKLFSFIIISWWVFLIIVAVFFLILAWQGILGFIEMIVMLFSKERWERYFAIVGLLSVVAFILLLRSCHG